MPDERLVEKAQKLIRMRDVAENIYISAEEARVHLAHAMRKYGFDWKVCERDMASRACVDLPNRTLYIKKALFVSVVRV